MAQYNRKSSNQAPYVLGFYACTDAFFLHRKCPVFLRLFVQTLRTYRCLWRLLHTNALREQLPVICELTVLPQCDSHASRFPIRFVRSVRAVLLHAARFRFTSGKFLQLVPRESANSAEATPGAGQRKPKPPTRVGSPGGRPYVRLL